MKYREYLILQITGFISGLPKLNWRINNVLSPNIVYTLFGASGSNYSRVTFDCATSQVQHRMPNIAYTARCAT